MSELIFWLRVLAFGRVGILTEILLGGLPLQTIGLLGVQSVSRPLTERCEDISRLGGIGFGPTA